MRNVLVLREHAVRRDRRLVHLLVVHKLCQRLVEILAVLLVTVCLLADEPERIVVVVGLRSLVLDVVRDVEPARHPRRCLGTPLSLGRAPGEKVKRVLSRRRCRGRRIRKGIGTLGR